MNIKSIIKTYVVCLSGIAFSLISLHAAGNEDYPVINSNELLSSEELSSTYHRIDSINITDGYYQFEVESDIGHFSIFSLALLKKRVNEMKTLGRAINLFEQENDEFSGKLRSELSVSGESAVDILTSPFSTASKLAGQISSNLEGTLAGEDPYVDYVSGRDSYREPKDPTTAAHKRNIAFQLGLDLYSNNAKVQSFLNSVANARSAGKVSAGIGLTNAYSQSNTSELDRKISLAIKSNSLAELMDYNRQLLTNIRIKPEVASAFIEHVYLSPTNKTTILVYLNEIKRVNKLGTFIELALTANNEVMASVYTRLSKSLWSYYNDVERISVFINFKGQPAFITQSRQFVLIEPADLLIWSSEKENQLIQFSKHAKKSGYQGWELLGLGNVSSLTMQKLNELDYQIRDNFLSEFKN